MSEAYAWPEMPRHELRDPVDHPWHVAINRYAEGKKCDDWPRFMYEAKTAAHEVPRLALLFKHEREGKLAKTFRRCSCCPDSKHVVDNHLTCCLGKQCRECPHLAGLNSAAVTDEQRDWLKAWTCVAHILESGGDLSGEGYVQTVDDRMFWESTYASLALAAQAQD